MRNSLNTGVLRGHFECIFEVGSSIACDLRQAHVGDSFEAALHVQSQGASRFSGPASGGKKECFFIFFCIQTFKMRQRRFGTPKVAVAWALLLDSRQELQLPAQPVATHKVPT